MLNIYQKTIGENEALQCLDHVWSLHSAFFDIQEDSVPKWLKSS